MFCKFVMHLITFKDLLNFHYRRLSGLSPFMGDTDMVKYQCHSIHQKYCRFISFQDTMANVTLGKYSFNDDAFKVVSENAKDFVRSLLVKDGE